MPPPTSIFISHLLRFIRRRVVDLDQSTASIYHDELDKISKHLLDFNSVIGDAEQMEYDEDDLRWLLNLQVVLDLLDDRIDEVQIVNSNNQQSQLIPKQVSSSVSQFNPFSRSKKLAKELQFIRKRLHNLAMYAERFSFYVTHTNVERRRRVETSSYVDRSEIIGREKDEVAVIDLISKPVSERASVVPIVGLMGVGKTTLAQLIFNHPRIQDMFDLQLWLSLPHESHGILETLRGALIQLEGAVHDERDAEQMKTELHKLLEMKRAFIVLDHVKDINLHISLLSLVQDIGSEGSVIIVTTRSRRVASLIGTTAPYQLEPLTDYASYHLLTKICGDETQSRPEWEPNARAMVKLCSGVPLFLRMLGSFLNGIEPEWKPCLEYLMLPLASFRLQKACGISVEALKCVWMALGLLYSDDPTQPPESIASNYLQDLVDYALCLDVEYAPGGVVRRIKFNKALLDFATFTAGHQWGFMQKRHRSFEVLDAESRCLIWDEDDLSAASELFSFFEVRLFILCLRRQASAGLVNDIIYHFKRLRVLGFGGCNIEMLPDSIGELKHLRYLDVGRNVRMKRLPASICYLWHLQTLFLHGCSQLEELPANLTRLQNLRYLTLAILKERLPEEMGYLVSLRTLGLSSCPRLASLPSSIKNLKNLQTLGIADCNVLDLIATPPDEGFKGLDPINTLLLSHLPKFVGLPTDLGNPSIAMKHLMIQSCPLLIETTWIMQFRSLRSLTIEDCPQLPALTSTHGTSQLDGVLELVIRRCPSLGNMEWIRGLVSLRSLIIDGCPKLVELDAGFSELKRLERLEIRRCPGLSEWFASTAGKDWLRSIPHVRLIELDGVRLES